MATVAMTTRMPDHLGDGGGDEVKSECASGRTRHTRGMRNEIFMACFGVRMSGRRKSMGVV